MVSQNIQARVFNMRCVLFLMLVFWHTISIAEVRIISSLDFGTVAILDNTTIGFLNINESGGFTSSDHFLVITPSQYGLIELYDYLPGSEVDLTATVIQATSTSPVISPEKFTLTNVNIVDSVLIDSTGVAQVRFGGRLETSGNSSLSFADTQYTHRIQISVNF